MSRKKHFIGIDLGTTNSSIAFTNLQRDGTVRPVNIKVKQTDQNGGITRSETLPSVVYFDQGIDVGQYARSRRTLFPEKVVSSVKNWMGRSHSFDIGDKTVNPVEVSTLILKKLKRAAEEMLQTEIHEAVVAVPASFDNDMRADTLEAMEKAGFRVKDDSGAPLDVLIDEPRAALFDLLNKQERGEIATSILDRGETKNILVYDLGGGTLDVSMHLVTITEEGEMELEDLAISRYTQIGGDVFDQRIADWMLQDFLKRNPEINWENIDELQRKEVTTKLLAQAEQVKIELSKEEDVDDLWGSDGTVEVSPGFLLGNKIYSTQFTKDRYREIVEDLLGDDLEYDNYQFIEDLEDQENIVYPILDVLRKAYDRTGKEPEIDIVLLTGGMSEFPIIQEVLRRIFDRELFQIVEPIFAVSRGAALYNYMKSNTDFKSNPILNETIQLGLNQGALYPLIREGTVLPVSKNIDDTFIIPKNTSKIRIPLYRGERQNSIVLMRSAEFQLPNTRSSGTEVAASISIDRNKIVSFRAWLVEDPEINVHVEIRSDGRSSGTTSSTPPSQTSSPQPTIVEQPAKEEDISKLIRQFDSAISRQNEKESKQVELRIIAASNAKLFLPFLIKRYANSSNSFLKDKRLPILISGIMVRHGENGHRDQFISLIKKNLQIRSRVLIHDVPNRIFGAILAAGRVKATECLPQIRELYYSQEGRKVHSILITTVGKIGVDETDVKICMSALQKSNTGNKIVAAWSIGKLASLQKDNPIQRTAFKDALNLFYRVLSLFSTHSRFFNLNYVRNVVFAVGEVLDNRYKTQPVITKVRRRFIIVLVKIANNRVIPVQYQGPTQTSMYEWIKEFCLTVVKMLRGETLTEEEESTLLELRNKD